ncbi:MAG: hypothetical protein WED00_11885 [Aquisalimonadaceae bacterium]
MTSAPTRPNYTSMFRRHRKAFLIPFAVLFGVSVTLATVLPPAYEGTATVEIEKQEVPAHLLEPTVVVGYIDEYLDALGRKVMSNDNLWEIAQALDLYPAIRGEGAELEVAALMRRSARREIVYVDVGPEDQRSTESIAVAFTTTFVGDNPDTARDVANALAKLYIEESRRLRVARAAELTEFLRVQTDALAARVAEYEQDLASFKQQHGASLPEFAANNMRLRETTQDQLDRLGEAINALNQQKIGLQAQLVQIEPRMDTNIMAVDPQMLSLPQQVERLRLDYLRISGVYSPRHPDLARLRNDLRALTGESPRAASVLELVSAIEDDRAQLLTARRDHADDHPVVLALQRRIGERRERLRALGSAGDGTLVMADNPAYIAVSSSLKAVEADLAAELEQRAILTRRLGEFDNRLQGSPGIEKNYRALSRDYENALKDYQESRDKLLMAEAAERMEASQLSASHFRLVSPATRPDEPARPQRAGIAVLGFILAAGMGTGFAAIAEYFDRTVRGVSGLIAQWGAPPIAAIPVITTRSEKRAQLVRLGLGWVVLLALIAAALLGAYVFGPAIIA